MTTNEMRILTVRQPWAWAIIHGGKDVENRVRNVAGTYRGSVAIHVALQEDEDAYSVPVLVEALERRYMDWVPAVKVLKRMRSEPSPKYHGRIIGVVDLVDVHGERPPFGRFGDPCCTSPWGEHDGGVHLVLANPRPLAEPIPYKGALGLRRLDADMTARILAQIGAK